MATGGLTGAVFNAAKERALDAFLEGAIPFPAMADVVEETLSDTAGDALLHAEVTLDNVRAADHLARQRAAEAVARRQ
jgi:1-deoxy-D-xylulose-5-phosphate reductoisomerase